MDHPRTASRTFLPALLAGLLSGSGCSIDITRTRVNLPLNQEAYRQLSPGKTTLDQALKTLGAPDKVEAYPDKDYLWYLHQDSTRVGLRLESPISFFGYRHTIAELDQNAEDTDAMRLVFERNGVLLDKSLRLAPAFSAPEIAPSWAFHILPRYGYSPLVAGDGGQEPFGKLFDPGQLFGGYVGVLPVPCFMFLVGGNYQTYPGGTFRAQGQRVHLDDLRLYQAEIGGRFQLPPEFFATIGDMDKMKELFYSNDLQRHQGLFLFFQWTVGATFNEEVGARFGATPSGSYFDKSLGLSTTVGVGVEYYWRRLGLQAGIDYQAIDAFESGDVRLDTDAGSFQSFILTAGASYRF